jgi:hypothetical protein
MWPPFKYHLYKAKLLVIWLVEYLFVCFYSRNNILENSEIFFLEFNFLFLIFLDYFNISIKNHLKTTIITTNNTLDTSIRAN